MYTKLDTVDRDLPHCIWGSVTIHYLQAMVEQDCSTIHFFAQVHLATPLHLWHTFRGESSPAFGLQVLMS